MVQLEIYFAGIFSGYYNLTTELIKYYIKYVKSLRAKQFGEKKATVFFLVLHLVISIMASVLNLISSGNEDVIYWITRCWNKEVSSDLFCLSHTFDTIKYFGEEIANIFNVILRSICGCLRIFNLVVFLNIAELILYTTIFKLINR